LGFPTHKWEVTDQELRLGNEMIGGGFSMKNHACEIIFIPGAGRHLNDLAT
jgi:hypothetical protein